ncbi:MAG: hypothetical protein JSW71_22515 [Gemmatimonadota bacterium]|nr:MAG: hypothetical protein JSW71_22515 [Gemmatimonadota bacterium]
MRRIVTTLSIAGLLAPICAQGVAAQDRGDPDWYFVLAPYLWFSNLDGAVSLGLPPDDQVAGPYVVPVGDEKLERSWLVRAEVGKGKLRAWLNASGAKLENSTVFMLEGDPSDSTAGTYDFSWHTGELYAAYQVGAFTTTNAIELYAGARYMRHKQILTPSGDQATTIDESWIDPVIGSRFYTELGRRFWVTFNGDIGGFSVGSDFTWSIGGELGFRVLKPLDVSMRYNYQEIDYDNRKDGADAYRWSNGVQQGWFFGAIIKL